MSIEEQIIDQSIEYNNSRAYIVATQFQHDINIVNILEIPFKANNILMSKVSMYSNFAL